MPDTMLPTVAPTSPAIPVEITKAIVAVMAGIGKLCKEDHNSHDRYNFVSIDGFLSAVNPLCAEAGLVIIQDEDSVEFVERQTRNGSSTWLRITYSFTIAHVSGAVMPRQPRRTVMTIANGAQAFGSAQSYSLKQFLRSLFQISTGDKDDPDFQQTQEIGSAPPKAPQKPPQRVEVPKAATHAVKQSERTQQPPGDSVELPEPVYTPIAGNNVGKWLSDSWDLLSECPVEWCRKWLDLHSAELAQVRERNAEWADSIEKLGREEEAA